MTEDLDEEMLKAIRKDLAQLKKQMRKLLDHKGDSRLKLRDGSGEPTDDAFEVLEWITRQGRTGVTTRQLGNRYEYSSRQARNKKKDQLDELFNDLIHIHQRGGSKCDRIINPKVKEESTKHALRLVKAKRIGEVECPECGGRYGAKAVVSGKIRKCRKEGCDESLQEVFEENYGLP